MEERRTVERETGQNGVVQGSLDGVREALFAGSQ